MCKELNVSETGYYKWKRSQNKLKSWQLLLVEIHKILDAHPDNENYGINRVHIALEQKGVEVSRSTVIRAMRKGNLLHKNHRSPNGLTKADKKAQRPENLLQRNFTASEPNKKWLTDITEVSCSDGKLYVAPVLDCFGGEIINIEMEDHMRKELCIQAIKNAYKSRTPGNGVLIHSDAGSQYTSENYKKMLGKYRAIQSMSDVGKCYDNARMESFFATLKKEKLYKMNTKKITKEKVKTIIWRYTMVYYNQVRISTVNEGGWPPTIYRLKVAEQKKAA